MITRILRNCLGLAIAILLVHSTMADHHEADASKPSERKLLGWMRTGSGPMRPIYAEDVKAEAQSISKDAEKLAAQVNTITIDPNAPKDEIEKQFKGSMSLTRHQADVNELRDRFVDCMTAMESNLKERKEAGKLTEEDQKQFDECKVHCDGVLKLMDKLHKNTSSMRTATRQKYFLDAWDEHKKVVEQLRKEAASCPAMFDMMIKSTGTPSKGNKESSMHEGHEGKDLSGMFDKGSCCDKAHAAGKVCEHPCCKEAADTGKVCVKCNPGAAGKS